MARALMWEEDSFFASAKCLEQERVWSSVASRYKVVRLKYKQVARIFFKRLGIREVRLMGR